MIFHFFYIYRSLYAEKLQITNVAMDSDTIAGIVVLITGIVVSVVVFWCLRYLFSTNGALRVAAMACGATLTVGALVPQAIRNSTDPEGLLDGFSPFLLLLFPLAIVLKLMPEISVLHTLSVQRKNGQASDSYWIVKVSLAHRAPHFFSNFWLCSSRWRLCFLLWFCIQRSADNTRPLPGHL